MGRTARASQIMSAQQNEQGEQRQGSRWSGFRATHFYSPKTNSSSAHLVAAIASTAVHNSNNNSSSNNKSGCDVGDVVNSVRSGGTMDTTAVASTTTTTAATARGSDPSFHRAYGADTFSRRRAFTKYIRRREKKD